MNTLTSRIRRLCGWVALATAATLSPMPPVSAADTLRYGADHSFAPFEFVDAAGQPAGFQIELVRAVGRIAGLDIRIVQQGWTEIEAEFRAGRVDAIAMSHARSREAWALFLRPHATPAMAIYHLTGSHVPVSIAELAGHEFAVPDGEAMRETLAELFSDPAFRFIALPGPRAALEALRDGRVRYALALRTQGDALLATGSFPTVSASNFSLRLQAYGFAVAPGATALKGRLEQALDQMEQSGELDALRVKWLSSERSVAENQALQRKISREEWGFGLLGALGALLIAALALVLRRHVGHLRRERRQRRELENALTEARTRLSRLFTHSPDCMLIIERSSLRIADVNEALCSLLGAPRARLIGEAATALPGIVDAAAVESLHRMMNTGGALAGAPLKLRSADGSMRDCLVNAEAFTENQTAFSLVVIRDISAQLARDEDMRRGYETLMESARARAEDLEAQLHSARQGQAHTQDELQSYTAAVSHDLRSPLRAIMGFSEAVREDLKAGLLAEADRHAERIGRSARRMDLMLEGLTRLARLGQSEPLRITVDMTQLAREAWEMAMAAEPGRHIQFRGDAMPPAGADPDLMMVVWQNLLDNAIKYTTRRAEAKVAADAFEEGGRIWYRVADNGAGFDMKYADKLFKPFQRLHTAEEFPGTGIGLTMVRRIVERHGGEIRARGTINVGAVLEFTLTPAPGN